MYRSAIWIVTKAHVAICGYANFSINRLPKGKIEVNWGKCIRVVVGRALCTVWTLFLLYLNYTLLNYINLVISQLIFKAKLILKTFFNLLERYHFSYQLNQGFRLVYKLFFLDEINHRRAPQYDLSQFLRVFITLIRFLQGLVDQSTLNWGVYLLVHDLFKMQKKLTF